MEKTILSDKNLHCIARMLQNIWSERDTHCLYCKYAFQCLEQHNTTKKIPFFETLEKLQGITGVKICLSSPGTMQKDILAGSWIEKSAELLNHFTGMSFEEQLGSLQNPDILKYKDSCFPEA